MRLLVILGGKKSILLPWNYPHFLYGFIYAAITKVSPKVGTFLYERGFTSRGYRYKLSVFSRLFLQRVKGMKKEFWSTFPIQWWIGSPWGISSKPCSPSSSRKTLFKLGVPHSL